MPVARCCAAISKQRDVLMLSYTLGFTHAERRPYAVIQAGLSIQRDVLMLSCKLGCNPDFPCIAAGGHDIKHEESAQGRCRHMASPCADSP